MVHDTKEERIPLLRAGELSGRVINSTQGLSRNSVAGVLNATDSSSRSWD